MDTATAIIIIDVLLGAAVGFAFRFKGLAWLSVTLVGAILVRLVVVEFTGVAATGIFGLYLAMIYTIPLLTLLLLFSGLFGVSARALLDQRFERRGRPAMA